jgi:hypothetical protein
MTVVTPQSLSQLAAELASAGSPDAPEALAREAGEDRRLLEDARNLVAARLHASVDDWSSTAALSLLNKTLARMPRHDPLDWRVRWSQRFRMP